MSGMNQMHPKVRTAQMATPEENHHRNPEGA
jgi:hypothetical protein